MASMEDCVLLLNENVNNIRHREVKSTHVFENNPGGPDPAKQMLQIGSVYQITVLLGPI